MKKEKMWKKYLPYNIILNFLYFIQTQKRNRFQAGFSVYILMWVWRNGIVIKTLRKKCFWYFFFVVQKWYYHLAFKLIFNLFAVYLYWENFWKLKKSIHPQLLGRKLFDGNLIDGKFFAGKWLRNRRRIIYSWTISWSLLITEPFGFDSMVFDEGKIW